MKSVAVPHLAQGEDREVHPTWVLHLLSEIPFMLASLEAQARHPVGTRG